MTFRSQRNMKVSLSRRLSGKRRYSPVGVSILKRSPPFSGLHREHPADHKRHEDPVTRSAQAVPETNLVNPQRIWYIFLHPGVPPSGFFISQNRSARNAFPFQVLSDRSTLKRYKKGETTGPSGQLILKISSNFRPFNVLFYNREGVRVFSKQRNSSWTRRSFSENKRAQRSENQQQAWSGAHGISRWPRYTSGEAWRICPAG
jgi:hypothetical protein